MKHSKWTRLAWILAGLSILAALIEFVFWLEQQTGPSSISYWVSALGWMLALPVLFSMLGALIITRQPGNRVGWLMMIVALAAVNPVATILHSVFASPTVITPSLWLLVWLDSWSWVPLIFAIFLIPLHFPSGRPPAPRWNWVNLLALGMWLIFVVLVALADVLSPSDNTWALPNPVGFIPSAVMNGPILIIWGLGLITVVSASVASLYVRYRRARAVERDQIKWLLYAGVFFVISYALTYFLTPPSDSQTGFQNVWLILSVLGIPVAIAIAILRYSLYDINVIIRKTLLYAALTALLALVYFGIVVLLQRLFGAVTGGGQSPLAIVVSTLVIAALFTPLRRRIQDWIDRRFFRKKYDAQQVLAQFALTARDETDLDALTAELVHVVQETMQPEKVSVWLKERSS
jgi:hypothetical protein